MDGSRERHITTVPPHQCYRLNFWYEQDHVHLLCKASPCFSHSHKLCALTILSPPQDDRVLRRCVKQLVQTGKRKEHKKYLAGEISNWESINQYLAPTLTRSNPKLKDNFIKLLNQRVPHQRHLLLHGTSATYAQFPRFLCMKQQAEAKNHSETRKTIRMSSKKLHTRLPSIAINDSPGKYHRLL